MKKRGNPNWGRPSGYIFPVEPSRWEVLLKSLRIEEEDRERLRRSVKVRQFVHKNFHSHYVPEWLLEDMGLSGLVDEFYLCAPRELARYAGATA